MGDELDVVRRDHDRMSVVRELFDDLGEPCLGGRVEPAGGLVEQQHPRRAGELQRDDECQTLTFGEVAGVRVGRDVDREPVEDRGARARRRPGIGVGLRAFRRDGREVEQISRRLRHEADAALGRSPDP